MDRNSDLDAALSFVIGRIAEQATLTGEPLSDAQRLLLKYPPSYSGPGFSWDMPELALIPRNFDLERVCALAKAVYQRDRQANPASLEWKFAFAVFMFNRHSMRGLLQWLGMKFPRPKWDLLTLMATGLVPIVFGVLLVLSISDSGSFFLPACIGAAGLAIMIWMFFVFDRIQKRQFAEEIEKCRSHYDLFGKGTSKI